MTPERALRLRQLFHQALTLAPPDRAAFLEEACGDDARLRRELEDLLAADEAADEQGFMNTPVLDLKAHAAAVGTLEGQHVGPYRIIREVGRGGMGRVFLAEREDVGKQVALKVVQGTLAAPETLHRFLFERRVLARLEHPHIARLLDAGTTQDGAPYLVMEYVEGEPITRYCDRMNRSVRQRLHLFLAVCDAVQYAHQNLIIHRDLKPSNIMVTGEGVVKLLDFGIAKLVEEDASDVTLTRTGLHVMTPGYAAPEQVRGGPVTTATDVYALGIVLYELLTGQRPYDVRGRSLSEIEQIICEEEPMRPSTLIARMHEQARRTTRSSGQAVGADLEQLRQYVRGDLDTIVMHALSKDPARRYATAAAFGDDLRRYLAGRPVQARPQTVRYRAATFLRRHRFGAAVSVLLLMLLLGFFIREGRLRAAAEAARDEARQEAETAEEVTAFLVGLFDVSDPFSNEAARGDTLTARSLLQRGLDRVDRELADRPAVRAALLDKIGSVYLNLGLFAPAESLLTVALEQRRALFGEEHEDVAESLHSIGWLRYEQGDYDAAEAYLREALTLFRRLHPEDRLETAAFLNDLALVLNARGKTEEAETYQREALALWQEGRSGEHPDVATGMANLAVVLVSKGDYPGAAELLRSSLTLRQRLLGPDHPDVATNLNNLAGTVLQLGDYAAAESLFWMSLAHTRRVLGEDHPHLIRDLSSVAFALHHRGRLAEAESLYVDALERSRRINGDDHPMTTTLLHNLASVLEDRGDLVRAEALFRQILAVRMKEGEEYPELATTMNGLAGILRDRGAYDESEAMYRRVLEIRERTLGPRHPLVAISLSNLAGVLRDREQYREASELYRRAIDLYAALYPDGHPNAAVFKSNLSACLIPLGAYEEAEMLLLESLSVLEEARGPDHDFTRVARERLVQLYEAWGQPDQADAYRTP